MKEQTKHKPDALSGAERQKRYRENLRLKGYKLICVAIDASKEIEIRERLKKMGCKIV